MSSEIAIRCEGLSKQYRIGQQERYKALRDVVTDAAAAPFRRLGAAFRNGNGTSATRKSELGKRDSETIWALDDVSFEVKPGEAVGVIGRNGAGKSTLLKVLSQITKPTKGHAEIHGRVGSLLEVGTGFHPELSGRENIFLNAAILGMRRAEVQRKFDEIVAFAEVEKFIDTPVKHYSSGMYVRLAFSVAAHMETGVLLIDEVLAVGDAAFQKKCLGRISDAARDGRTVLFVSHDMTAVQVLCQRAVYLERGSIAGIGDVEQQIAAYLQVRKQKEVCHGQNVACLGECVELRRFEFTPNPVIGGSSLQFVLDLSARKPVRLDEAAILIYSSLGRRLAIVDLRNAGRTLRLDENKIESIKGEIRALPFVEGDYQIGLYLNWGEVGGDFYDLTELTVLNEARPGDLVPYQAAARGIVELDYTVN